MALNYNLTESAINSKNGVQLVYVLDCIKNSNYATDENKVFVNDFETIKFFFDCFNKEFNYRNNIKRFPNLQERIKEYLQGLPSCFTCAFYNCDIIDKGVKFGVLTGSDERKNEKFINNWFNVLAYRILQTADKVNFVYFPYTFVQLKTK